MYVIFEQLKFYEFVIYRGIHFTVCILKVPMKRNFLFHYVKELFKL